MVKSKNLRVDLLISFTRHPLTSEKVRVTDSELATMEEITDGVNNINLAVDSQKKNQIQVSNTKKPLFFYVNLSKRYMQQYNDVELSALGMAEIQRCLLLGHKMERLKSGV